MFGSAYRPGRTGLFISIALSVHTTSAWPSVFRVTVMGVLRLRTVPDAGVAVVPFAVANVGRSVVRSVPGLTGNVTVRLTVSTRGATLRAAGSWRLTLPRIPAFPDCSTTS